jgi:hypothetical protein
VYEGDETRESGGNRRPKLRPKTYLLLTTLTAAIRAEHGLSIEMIEKDFRVTSRDDPAIVSIAAPDGAAA